MNEEFYVEENFFNLMLNAFWQIVTQVKISLIRESDGHLTTIQVDIAGELGKKALENVLNVPMCGVHQG